jgi:mono/diheme cytochrome c family protein
MKFTVPFLLSASILGSATWLLVKTKPAQPPSAVLAVETPVTRGAYLVKLGGCTDCHTPKIMTPNGPVDDPDKLFAGHPAGLVLPPPNLDPNNPWGAATAGMTAWTGPWGVSFAANLTPDLATGLGGWSEKVFIQAMRTGKHRGEGRAILPPMPWQPLAEAKDEDLTAIFAYLKSLPAVANHVPGPLPPVSAAR